MTTKAQERKALEQIRKIVEGLGEDSYVMAAFEGCFEIAARNIENDWNCSMKQRAESAEKTAAAALERANEAMERQKIAEKVAINNQKEAEAWKKAYEDISNSLKYETDKHMELFRSTCDQGKMIEELKANLEAKDIEIMKMKAKLYDLLTANN